MKLGQHPKQNTKQLDLSISQILSVFDSFKEYDKPEEREAVLIFDALLGWISRELSLIFFRFPESDLFILGDVIHEDMPTAAKSGMTIR